MNDANSLVVRNIGCLIGMAPDSPLTVQDAAVWIDRGVVRFAGPAGNLDQTACRGVATLDAGGGLVTPGLVDCHTHLVFAGNRADEWEERARGVSYEAIAARGGGIMRTVEATRAASRPTLLQLGRRRMRRALRHGITTLEIKSGYGLDLASEIKILEVARQLAEEGPVGVVPTFLGAHAVPPEARGQRDAHVDDLVSRWIPKVASEKLAEFCDVFCEGIAFSVEESERILRAGLAAGLRPKVHAEQLGRFGGAAMAARVGAVSADHLDFADESDLRALAKAGTVAVLLPGCAVTLGNLHFPDARPLLRAGLRVALSTDFNPGTSMTQDLLLMGTLAIRHMGMTVAEAWAAITCHAAAALGRGHRSGRLVPGFDGDLVVFDAVDAAEPFYDFSDPLVRTVVRRGAVCWNDPDA